MNETKPIPVVAERSNTKCPVCGQRSYSQGGIHPQCAVIQADAPRKTHLAAEKKAKAVAAAVVRKLDGERQLLQETNEAYRDVGEPEKSISSWSRGSRATRPG